MGTSQNRAPATAPPLPAPARVESRAMSANGRHAAQLVADRQDDGRDHISLMTRFRRHAIYWAPPAGSAFARFGASWLGWDAETGQPISAPCQHAAAPHLVAEPRRYGFHATLKPPLRLAEGMAESALESAVAKLAASVAPFQIPALRTARMGSRVALVSSASSAPLDRLAARAVTELDEFRAAPDAAELAKRRAVGLSPRQERMLMRWGYPFVLDEFRFHLTLTNRLPAETLGPTFARLTELTAPFCHAPLPITEICLFGEDDAGFFHIYRRFPLSG